MNTTPAIRLTFCIKAAPSMTESARKKIRLTFSSPEPEDEPDFHPGFDDLAAKIVIKSADGVSFRTYDYFLKAGR
jgi:hypothetical protein